MKSKILVVDDDESIVIALQALLTLEGYEVSVARNGEEALELYYQINPDMILLDIMMPLANGIEVARILRKEDTKLIMLTAKGLIEDKMEGYSVGADEYIVKPFSNDEILEVIKFHLE